MTDETGTLKEGEIHPMAHSAFAYVKNFMLMNIKDACILQESLASSALSGNRTAEILWETYRRIMSGEAVSDRYLLGLSWFLKMNEEELRNERSDKTTPRRSRSRRADKLS